MFFFISGKYTECRFTSTCFEQNITQMAALNIDTLMQPLLVVVHDLENHFRCNGSNHLSYRLLQSFQSQGTLFVNLCFDLAPEKKLQGVKSDERGGHPICYRRPAISYKLLNNKGSMFSWSTLKTARTPLFDDALPTRSYAPSKSGSSFCRTLYST